MGIRRRGRTRHAEAVDRLVEEAVHGQLEHDEEAPDPLASPLLRLRGLTYEALDPHTTARQAGDIRSAAEAAAESRAASRRSRSGRYKGHRPVRRRLAPVVVVALVTVLLAATVAVAQDAGPDHPLYGVKRGSEKVWLAVPRGGEQAATVHLSLAERRFGEARQGPKDREQQLIAEGTDNVEVAAGERPDEAIETFLRLLGDGEEALPETASPVARAAIHRNCVRIATKHDLGPERCGEAPEGAEHPGRGHGHGQGEGGPHEDGPPGWGPGGRPEGVEGPPPGNPGRGRGGGDD